MEQILTEKEREKVTEVAKRILSLEYEIKQIREDIKEIKAQAKEDDIPIKEVNAAISELKKEAKKPSGERAQEEAIKEVLENDSEVYHLIQTVA